MTANELASGEPANAMAVEDGYKFSLPDTQCKHAARLQRWLADGNSAVTLTLRRAAHIAALEPHYFSAAFHRWSGESFILWRRRQRVARAIEALQAGHQPVTDIAILAGYRDRRSLERAITAVTGRTLGQLTNKLRGVPQPLRDT